MENFKFKKSYGQNFLIDNNIIDKIINNSQITKDTLVIEIGPGSGSLTGQLVKKNCSVLAFEIDERFKEKLSNIQNENLKVIYCDFLKADVLKYMKEYNYKQIGVVANIPYYITSPIIKKIINEIKPDFITIMIQEEVANRIIAEVNTKEYNSLSLYVQYYYNIRKICKVNKKCFVPIPKVDSVVLNMKKREDLNAIDETHLFKLIRESFKYKRKNLKNNLKNYNLNNIELLLKDINKDLTHRAEQLTLDDFIYLSNNLVNKTKS